MAIKAGNGKGNLAKSRSTLALLALL